MRRRRCFAELANTNTQGQESAQLQIREAFAWYAKKDYAKSLQKLQEGLPTLKDPAELAEAFYLVGMNHLALKQNDKAESAFRKSVGGVVRLDSSRRSAAKSVSRATTVGANRSCSCDHLPSF